MTKSDWINKFIAKPEANQKKILNTLAMMSIAHMSMEKDPTDLDSLMREYCEKQLMIGATAMT